MWTREKQREYHRLWVKRNQDKIRRYNSTPEHKAKTAAWKKTNLDRVRAHNRTADSKRRALTLARVSATANIAAVTARFAYYGNRCVYCGRADLPLQLDHIKPLTKNGLNLPANWAPACKECNRKKSNKWSGPATWIRCRDYGMSLAAISPDSARRPCLGR